MHSTSVIGIDLGKKTTGICHLKTTGNAWSIGQLSTVETPKLESVLTDINVQAGPVVRVVVDAPIGESKVASFRPVDKVFMRGEFNNNNKGLQPNNPGLLDIDVSVLKATVGAWGMLYSNDWLASPSQPVLRETFPNVVMGTVLDPDALLEHRNLLRFRFGKGRSVPFVSAAFDFVVKNNHVPPFFEVLEDADSMSWEWLDSVANFEARTGRSDDLIAALSCALVAAHDWNGNGGYVSVSASNDGTEVAGHYTLPGRVHMDEQWANEINRICSDAEFNDRIKHTF